MIRLTLLITGLLILTGLIMALYTQPLQAVGGDGYLIWSYRDRYSTDTMEYNAADPLAGVVSGY